MENKEGFKGACPTCEPVGMLNQELEKTIQTQRKIIEKYEEYISFTKQLGSCQHLAIKKYKEIQELKKGLDR